MPQVKPPRIKVTQKEGEEVPVEILAKAIVEVADGMRKVRNSRLTRSAIVALIHDRSGIAKGTIELVLNNLDQLEDIWLKKKF